MAIDSETEVLVLKIDVGYILLLFSKSDLKREAEAMFSKHKLQAGADFKTTLLRSNSSAFL